MQLLDFFLHYSRGELGMMFLSLHNAQHFVGEFFIPRRFYSYLSPFALVSRFD